MRNGPGNQSKKPDQCRTAIDREKVAIAEPRGSAPVNLLLNRLPLALHVTNRVLIDPDGFLYAVLRKKFFVVTSPWTWVHAVNDPSAGWNSTYNMMASYKPMQTLVVVRPVAH